MLLLYSVIQNKCLIILLLKLAFQKKTQNPARFSMNIFVTDIAGHQPDKHTDEEWDIQRDAICVF